MMKKTVRQIPHASEVTEIAPGDYAARVAIHASQERVFDAIATVEGIRGWWTPIVKGSGTPGAELRLEFEGLDEYIALRVERMTRPSALHWSCVAHTGLPEWAGTKMTFDLVERTSRECQLNFRHIGLTPKLECYDRCTLGWDHFLGSLVVYIERGTGMPFRAGHGEE
jgi:uncharacterized protein YndB with AHSA1/START domain